MTRSLEAQKSVSAISPVQIGFDAAKNDTHIRERKLSFERVVDFDFDSAMISFRKANPRAIKDYDQTYPTH